MFAPPGTSCALSTCRRRSSWPTIARPRPRLRRIGRDGGLDPTRSCRGSRSAGPGLIPAGVTRRSSLSPVDDRAPCRLYGVRQPVARSRSSGTASDWPVIDRVNWSVSAQFRVMPDTDLHPTLTLPTPASACGMLRHAIQPPCVRWPARRMTAHRGAPAAAALNDAASRPRWPPRSPCSWARRRRCAVQHDLTAAPGTDNVRVTALREPSHARLPSGGATLRSEIAAAMPWRAGSASSSASWSVHSSLVPGAPPASPTGVGKWQPRPSCRLGASIQRARQPRDAPSPATPAWRAATASTSGGGGSAAIPTGAAPASAAALLHAPVRHAPRLRDRLDNAPLSPPHHRRLRAAASVRAGGHDDSVLGPRATFPASGASAGYQLQHLRPAGGETRPPSARRSPQESGSWLGAARDGGVPGRQPRPGLGQRRRPGRDLLPNAAYLNGAQLDHAACPPVLTAAGSRPHRRQVAAGDQRLQILVLAVVALAAVGGCSPPSGRVRPRRSSPRRDPLASRPSSPRPRWSRCRRWCPPWARWRHPAGRRAGRRGALGTAGIRLAGRPGVRP